MRASNGRTRTVGLSILLGLIAAICLQAAWASASVEEWTEIPSYGNLEGYAIINYVTGSSRPASGTAYGEVELILEDSTAIGTIQYAPFARIGFDGEWNTLKTYRGYGSVALRWHDTFHVVYDGFKFRICGAHYCSRRRSYIYF